MEIPEFRINPENFHPCIDLLLWLRLSFTDAQSHLSICCTHTESMKDNVGSD